MIFWLSILISLLCILSAKGGSASLAGQAGGKTCQLNRWDILFFLSSWQIFNLKIWQNYLSDTQISDPYRISSAICILLVCLYLSRREIKINFEISGKAIKEWLMWTGILLGILLPLGFSIGFLRWNPKLEIGFIGNKITDYFIFTAVIEELVFRGLVYNILKRTYDENLSLATTTVLFAMIPSHIASEHFPNWPYAGMAFLAGSAYGISYKRTGNILVPILLHGTVDSIWRIFFS